LHRSSETFFLSSKTFLIAFLHSPDSLIGGSWQNFVIYLKTIVLDYFTKNTTIDIALFLLFISSTFWIIQLRPKLLLPALLLMIFARFRSNEIFHLGPFVVTLLILNTTVMLQKNISKISKVVIAVLSIPLMFFALEHYLLFLQEKPPVISSYQVEISNQIRQCKKNNQKLLVLDGDTFLYYLSDTLLETKYFYYLPWFEPTDKIRLAIKTKIESDSNQLIYLPPTNETDYRFFFADYIRQNYKQVCQNVWTIK